MFFLFIDAELTKSSENIPSGRAKLYFFLSAAIADSQIRSQQAETIHQPA